LFSQFEAVESATPLLLIERGKTSLELLVRSFFLIEIYIPR